MVHSHDVTILDPKITIKNNFGPKRDDFEETSYPAQIQILAHKKPKVTPENKKVNIFSPNLRFYHNMLCSKITNFYKYKKTLKEYNVFKLPKINTYAQKQLHAWV